MTLIDKVTLRALLEEMRQPHLTVDEDCWFSCPKSGKCCDNRVEGSPPEKLKCNCGADEHNAKLDQALTLLDG